VRILYGVVGEGMGHATRSRVIMDDLQKRHDLRVVASGRAASYLAETVSGVHEIWGLTFAMDGAEVRMMQTAIQNIRGATKGVPTDIRRYYELVRAFKPDAVITDFDSFAVLFAQRHRLPIISLDNIQMLDRCTHDKEILAGYGKDFRLAKSFVSQKVPRAHRYLITTFFYPPVRKKRTTLVPPILRPDILEARSEPGEHLLVYWAGDDTVPGILKAAGVPCKIYGMAGGVEEDVVDESLTYRPFSGQGFIDDLRTCRGLITGGGFSLLGEAVYLHKPILSIPLAGQAEQQVNARYVERLGYGRCVDELTDDVLRDFLAELPRYQETISTYRQDGNTIVLAELEGALESAAAKRRSKGKSEA
jgi:uncharacterized protein (TIGR00661 family)